MTKPTYEELAQRVKELEEKSAGHKQIIKVLLRNEEKYRLLYEQAPLGYQSLDENGHFLEVNQAWLDALGYTRDEVLGKSFSDFLDPEWQEHFKKNFPRFEAIGEILGIEFEMVKKDGSSILVSIHGKTSTHLDGTFKQAHCILHDVTQQRIMESQLRDSEEKNQMLLENIPHKIFYKDSSSVYVTCNRNFASNFAISPEQIEGKTDYDFFPEEMADKFRADDRRVMESGQTEIIEEEYQLPNGEKKCAQTVKKSILDKNGKVLGLLGIYMDITDSKLAQYALMVEKNMAQKYLDIAAVMFCALNSAGEITLINQKGCEILHVTAEEALGKNWFEHYVPKKMAAEVRGVFTQLMSGDIEPVEYYENPVLTVEGIEKIIAFHNTILHDEKGDITGILFSGEDISNRKKDHDELRRWWQVFEHAEWGIAIGSADKETFDLINPAYARVHGYSLKELLAQKIADGFAPDIRAELPGIMQKCHDLGHYTFEADHIRKDGTVFPVYHDVTSVKDEQGQVLYRIVNIQDITERKQAEEELRLHSEIMNRMSEGVYIIRMDDGAIIYTNPKFEELFGYDPGEMIGKNVSIVNYPQEKSPEETATKILEILDKNGSWQGEINNIKKDGTSFWSYASVSVFDHFKYGKVSVSVHTDITERMKAESEKQQLETQLRQAYKMEAIGTMAGGIAHDFNNILSIIIGYSSIIRDSAPEGSPVLESINEVRIAADRAKNLVKQILSFSRQAQQELIPMKLHSIARETIKLLRSTIPTTIKIVSDINPQCGVVEADPTQINQIIMNLCTNAVHAMDEKGILTVTLQEVTLDADALKHRPEMIPGPFVQLSVADTGTGMDAKIINRIFDPFFTTKEIGKGTGMGLSVVHGIVANLKGMITIESEVGQGTTFHVFFPKIEKEAVEPFNTLLPLPAGKERILVIDDEHMITDIVSRTLKGQGYHVTAETSSINALETFKSNPTTFDMVITDQTMPEMSGAELSAEILKIRPDMPIILCTGYSSKISAEESRIMGISEFMSKPVNRENLVDTVRKVLDNK